MSMIEDVARAIKAKDNTDLPLWAYMDFAEAAVKAMQQDHITAAAPDMLEALEQAAKWLGGWASAEHELEIIQKAISKAKGL